MSITTVRLPTKLEQQLRELARLRKTTKSEILKTALEQLIEREQPTSDAYSLGAELFGRHSSGQADLSTTYKEALKERLRAKHRAD